MAKQNNIKNMGLGSGLAEDYALLVKKRAFNFRNTAVTVSVDFNWWEYNIGSYLVSRGDWQFCDH
jgi:hypothetical protein